MGIGICEEAYSERVLDTRALSSAVASLLSAGDGDGDDGTDDDDDDDHHVAASLSQESPLNPPYPAGARRRCDRPQPARRHRT